MLAICGVIADCDTWEQIELFGKNHHDWFKRFLRLPNGIPSHEVESVAEKAVVNPQLSWQAIGRYSLQYRFAATGQK